MLRMQNMLLLLLGCNMLLAVYATGNKKQQQNQGGLTTCHLRRPYER